MTTIRGIDSFDTQYTTRPPVYVNVPTTTVEIPTDLPIGARYHIRKIHPTQGDVTITCEDHTFTPANLNSLTLTSNGDFWLLEKVASGKLYLVEGYDSGETDNGYFKRYACGEQFCYYKRPSDVLEVLRTGLGVNGSGTWVFPRPFLSRDYIVSATSIRSVSNLSIGTQDYALFRVRNTTASECNVIVQYDSTTNTLKEFSVSAQGRWF